MRFIFTEWSGRISCIVQSFFVALKTGIQEQVENSADLIECNPFILQKLFSVFTKLFNIVNAKCCAVLPLYVERVWIRIDLCGNYAAIYFSRFCDSRKELQW